MSAIFYAWVTPQGQVEAAALGEIIGLTVVGPLTVVAAWSAADAVRRYKEAYPPVHYPSRDSDDDRSREETTVSPDVPDYFREIIEADS